MSDSQQHESYDDDAQWVTIEDFSSPYQVEIHNDGRRRWRRRVSQTDTVPLEWQPGRPPEE